MLGVQRIPIFVRRSRAYRRLALESMAMLKGNFNDPSGILRTHCVMPLGAPDTLRKLQSFHFLLANHQG